MLTMRFEHEARQQLPGDRDQAIIGVVASRNLEVLLERCLPGAACEVVTATPLRGYDEIWRAVVEAFVERSSPKSLRISINDGGARPDKMLLRLLQGSALMDAA